MNASLEVQIHGNIRYSTELSINQQYTIGRKADCDIVLEAQPGISRKHLRLFFNDDHWIVETFAETQNPEFQGVEQSRFELKSSGVFTLGPYRFVFKTNTNETAKNDEFSSIDAPASQPIEATDSVQNNFSSSNEIDELENDSMDYDEAPQFDSLNETPAASSYDSEPSPFDEGELTAVQTLNSLPYIKIFEYGNKKAEYFRLEGHMWVGGSDHQAPIYLPSPQAAAAHFEISRDKNSYLIIDLGTPIGTLVNGQKISTTEHTSLQSGDLINIGSLTLRFELRDQSFQQKMSQIPLQMYESPLIFFGESAGKINTAPEELKQAAAVEIKKPVKTDNKSKYNRTPLLILAVVILGLGLFLQFDKKEQKVQAKKPVRKITPFDKLSKNEKRIVKESYSIARKFYLNRKYKRALTQYQKIHRVLSTGFKNSLGDQSDCENFIELKRQRLAIEKEKREQEAVARRVEKNIRSCQRRFTSSIDLQSATLCLSDAQATDPGNPGIEQLLSDIKARIEQKKTREKKAREIAEQSRQGKNLYFKAQSLYQAGLYLEAMDAFEAHIASGLPDTNGYVPKSKVQLVQIQNFIDSKKNQLLNSARGIASIDLKKALIQAREAALVDPRDYEISVYVDKLEKDLSRTVRELYMDSVLEERYGNLEASRTKWTEIIEKDVPDGNYYKKAARKLRQYGL